MTHSTRGQMVLLAAATIAVALVAMLFAFMQLGYTPAVTDPSPDNLRDVERTLERELFNATATTNTTVWSARDQMVSAVIDRLQPTLESLNRSALARTTLIAITYNASRASTWQRRHCPSGPARQFGACAGIQGVVVQERANETHVLAVAFDVSIVAEDSRLVAHTVIEHP